MPDNYNTTHEDVYDHACDRLQTLKDLQLPCAAQYGEMYTIHMPHTEAEDIQALWDAHSKHNDTYDYSYANDVLYVRHTEYHICPKLKRTDQFRAKMLKHGINLYIADKLPYNIQQVLLYASDGDIQHIKNVLMHSLSVYRLSNETVYHHMLQRSRQFVFCVAGEYNTKAVVPRSLLNTKLSIKDFNVMHLYLNSDCEDVCIKTQILHKNVTARSMEYDYMLHNYDNHAFATCELFSEKKHHNKLHEMSCVPSLLSHALHTTSTQKPEQYTHYIQSADAYKLSMTPLILSLTVMILFFLSLYSMCAKHINIKMNIAKYFERCRNAIVKNIQNHEG